MNRTSSFIFLLFISLLFNIVLNETLPNNDTKCGKVYDGTTKFDMNYQTSTSTIGANWVGFGEDVLFFEWSIISESFRIPSTSLNSQGCYEDLRVIKPDVMHWEVLKKNSFSAVKSNLSLQEGQKYFVLVRATYRSGHQIIAISDGVFIIPSSESPDSFYNFKTKETAPNPGNTFTTTRQERANPVLEPLLKPEDLVRTRSTISNARCSDPYFSTCPIDNENRCTQDDRKRVSNYLNLIYGKALFPVSEQLPPIIRVGPSPPEDDGADDDDSQSPAWILAPVLGFIFLIFLLCLCLICCVFICVNCLIRGDDNEGRADYGDIGDDNDGKDYGNRGGVNKADTTTNTKVEFPDTNIRRLSVDHNDEEEVNEEVKGTRRKHPIASSASSSFRDYRAAT